MFESYYYCQLRVHFNPGGPYREKMSEDLNGAIHNRCDTMGYYALGQGRNSRKKSFSLWHSATARCQRECRAEIFGILA